MNLQVLKLHTVLELWYVVIPICIFIVFAAKYLENILMPLLGFLLGTFFAAPFFIEWMGKVEFFKELQEKLLQSSTAQLIFALIVGVLCGAVLYGIYKLFVFLAGFSVAGALGYYAVRLIVQGKDLGTVGQFDLNFLVPIGCGILLGTICGLIAARNSSKVLALISMIVASGLLAFSIVGWVYVWINRSPVDQVLKIFEDRLLVFSLTILWLVVLGLAISFNFRRRVKQTLSSNKSGRINQ
ncbi:hypothetical protein [Pseudothermotoga sp.]|nr:hypothetical protein [Pseudothermotoga sp.]MCX7813587.1 hypothetical protein [Pseudothermotoga sp.]MDW8140009.1 hypothetical protein [Pseudothermotoga sp.]